MEEEDKELEAEYFGVFLPPSHMLSSSTAGPSYASAGSSPFNTSDWLYAPSTRKRRMESRPSSCGRQQSSVVPSEVEFDDLDCCCLNVLPH